MYSKEKERAFKKKIYHSRNIQMNEDGKYVCPEGYEFEYVKTTIDTKGKYPRENITYECKYCSTCTK